MEKANCPLLSVLSKLRGYILPSGCLDTSVPASLLTLRATKRTVNTAAFFEKVMLSNYDTKRSKANTGFCVSAGIASLMMSKEDEIKKMSTALSGELTTGEMYTRSLDRELFKRQESEQCDDSN